MVGALRLVVHALCSVALLCCPCSVVVLRLPCSGLVVHALLSVLWVVWSVVAGANINPHLVLYVFLPALLFEGLLCV